MYKSTTYRSPYPCYRPKSVPAVATTAGATTTHTNALCALSDTALYLIGLVSLLKDLAGPNGVREVLKDIFPLK